MCIFNFLTVVLKLFLGFGHPAIAKYFYLLIYTLLLMYTLFYDKIHADIMKLYLTNIDFC